MKVYRAEKANTEGIYSCYVHEQITLPNWFSIGKNTGNNWTRIPKDPYLNRDVTFVDFQRYYSTREFRIHFGFMNKEAAFEWFNAADIAYMNSIGFYLMEVDIEESDIVANSDKCLLFHDWPRKNRVKV